jgi:hypothetical protein
MVYAPRSAEDVDTVMKIVKAAANWISEENVEELAGEESKPAGGAVISSNA